MRISGFLQNISRDEALYVVVVMYLALVATLVYAIVMLIRVEEWPASNLKHAGIKLRAIEINDVAGRTWIRSGELAPASDNSKTGADAARPVQRRVHRTQATRSVVANLVWAPPGTFFIHDVQVTPAEREAIAAAEASANPARRANPSGFTELASR